MRPIRSRAVAALLVVLGGCVAPPAAPSGTSAPPPPTLPSAPPPTEPPTTVTVVHTCTVWASLDDYIARHAGAAPLAFAESGCDVLPEASLPCVLVISTTTWTDSTGRAVSHSSGSSTNRCPDDERSADLPSE